MNVFFVFEKTAADKATQHRHIAAFFADFFLFSLYYVNILL